MKLRPTFVAPTWDTVVFSLVTVLGLVFSLQRVVSPRQQAVASPSEAMAESRAELGDLIDLGCVDLAKSIKPVANTSGAIRFKGRVCGKTKTSPVLEDISVKNQRSQDQATVFQSVHFTFTTDALALEKGRNEIHLTWRQWGQPDTQTLRFEVFHK